LLFVGPPERSAARKIWPTNPSGLIGWPPVGLPPRLVVVEINAGNEKSPIGIDVGHSPGRGIGNEDGTHPGRSAIGGPAKLPAAVVIPRGAPALVLESVAAAVRVVDREPLFVAACGEGRIAPGRAAVHRAVDIIEEVLPKTEIEELAGGVGRQDRIAPENIVLQHTGESPGDAAIGGVTPAGLAKV